MGLYYRHSNPGFTNYSIFCWHLWFSGIGGSHDSRLKCGIFESILVRIGAQIWWFYKKIDPGNHSGVLSSIKKRTVIPEGYTVVIFNRNYPKYVFKILLLEVCFNLLIAFSLILRTRSLVRSKVSPISSRVIGCWSPKPKSLRVITNTPKTWSWRPASAGQKIRRKRRWFQAG